MIVNDQEFVAANERIAYFERVLRQLRETATPEEFQQVTGGYRVELERMQAEVVEYPMRPLDAPLVA